MKHTISIDSDLGESSVFPQNAEEYLLFQGSVFSLRERGILHTGLTPLNNCQISVA